MVAGIVHNCIGGRTSLCRWNGANYWPSIRRLYRAYASVRNQNRCQWLDVPQAVSVVTNARNGRPWRGAFSGCAMVSQGLIIPSVKQPRPFVIRGLIRSMTCIVLTRVSDGTLQSYRSLANIERVEIVENCWCTYGRAAGGIINLVTKRANIWQLHQRKWRCW